MEGIRIENATHAPLDSIPILPPQLPLMTRDILTSRWKNSGSANGCAIKACAASVRRINMIRSSFHAYGREMDSEFEYIFTDLRKTHNQGVFDTYSPDMLRCRKSGVLTGLPDGYGRGRIIGDYRRVALYGISYLVRERELQLPISSPVWKKAKISKPPFVCVRNWQNIAVRCYRFRKWRRNMALISLVQRRMHKKPCSGSTSLTWRQ
ncbi:keto-acid formate acetyltransferase [Escherichia coli]|nr:keto-acid formate acetyltransferase [Escherichia coli]